MIEMFEACCLFFGGFGLAIAVWVVRSRLDIGDITSDNWESRELGKEAIVAMVEMMKEHDIVELEITDSGFRVRRR